jgi:hypothetical protein
MNIDFTRTIIEKAFQLAVTESKELKSKPEYNTRQKLHAMRSQVWVETLAETFRDHYSKVDENIRVFSKYFKGKEGKQRKDFGLNELLFDISVVKINTIESPRHKELTYIEKALWIVESEMAKDTRQLVLDFSKLVMGDAKNKLFAGPINTYNKEQLEIFKKIALNCRGNFWVALIPHPGDWKESKLNELHLYRL